MNSAQIHLAFNHFPIAGMFFSIFFFLWVFVTKNENLKMAAVSLVILSGLLTIPVFYTGEDTSKLVRRKPFVSKYNIHEHEEKAESAMIFMMITTAVAIGYVFAKKQDFKQASNIYYGVFVLNLITVWFLANAAHEGGMIRHEEIRVGGSSNNLQPME